MAALSVTILPRRSRWRGDVRPRHTARPPYETRYPLKPKQVAVEERWGVTELIADRGWFRELGRLSWREATVYLVGDKTEPVSEVVDMAVPERRLARIARADQRAARRHAFFARINARSKTNRWVAAACSLFYLTMAGGLAVAMTALGDFGGTFAYPALILLATAGAYAGRVILRDHHEAPGAPTRDTDSGP